MILTTEEFGDLPDVDAASLDHILAEDAFGKFAILSASGTGFIQIGNDWRPGAESQAFLMAHDSDPWLLEYREGSQLHQASGQVTLDQARQAFMSYLAGTSSWRSQFSWIAIQQFEIWTLASSQQTASRRNSMPDGPAYVGLVGNPLKRTSLRTDHSILRQSAPQRRFTPPAGRQNPVAGAVAKSRVSRATRALASAPLTQHPGQEPGTPRRAPCTIAGKDRRGLHLSDVCRS